jgi:hypothetical protein
MSEQGARDGVSMGRRVRRGPRPRTLEQHLTREIRLQRLRARRMRPRRRPLHQTPPPLEAAIAVVDIMTSSAATRAPTPAPAVLVPARPSVARRVVEQIVPLIPYQVRRTASMMVLGVSLTVGTVSFVQSAMAEQSAALNRAIADDLAASIKRPIDLVNLLASGNVDYHNRDLMLARILKAYENIHSIEMGLIFTAILLTQLSMADVVDSDEKREWLKFVKVAVVGKHTTHFHEVMGEESDYEGLYVRLQRELIKLEKETNYILNKEERFREVRCGTRKYLALSDDKIPPAIAAYSDRMQLDVLQSLKLYIRYLEWMKTQDISDSEKRILSLELIGLRDLHPKDIFAGMMRYKDGKWTGQVMRRTSSMFAHYETWVASWGEEYKKNFWNLETGFLGLTFGFFFLLGPFLYGTLGQRRKRRAQKPLEERLTTAAARLALEIRADSHREDRTAALDEHNAAEAALLEYNDDFTPGLWAQFKNRNKWTEWLGWRLPSMLLIMAAYALYETLKDRNGRATQVVLQHPGADRGQTWREGARLLGIGVDIEVLDENGNPVKMTVPKGIAAMPEVVQKAYDDILEGIDIEAIDTLIQEDVQEWAEEASGGSAL